MTEFESAAEDRYRDWLLHRYEALSEDFKRTFHMDINDSSYGLVCMWIEQGMSITFTTPDHFVFIASVALPEQGGPPQWEYAACITHNSFSRESLWETVNSPGSLYAALCRYKEAVRLNEAAEVEDEVEEPKQKKGLTTLDYVLIVVGLSVGGIIGWLWQ